MDQEQFTEEKLFERQFAKEWLTGEQRKLMLRAWLARAELDGLTMEQKDARIPKNVKTPHPADNPKTNGMVIAQATQYLAVHAVNKKD